MSNIDKHALIAKIKKQTESFDTVVLHEDEADALLDELEAKDRRNAELNSTLERWAVDRAQSASELEATEKTSEARREALDRTHKMYQREKARAEAAEKRVAELEASHSKLRESMAAIHNTIRLDGVQTSLAVILNAAKRAHEESAAAASIRIKGED